MRPLSSAIVSQDPIFDVDASISGSLALTTLDVRIEDIIVVHAQLTD